MDNTFFKTEKRIYEFTLNKIARYLIYICVFYLFFLKYAFGERRIILYGTASLATLCMIVDLFIMRVNILELFPLGVLINPIMCVYSLITGILVATNQSSLISAVKTYAAFSLVCLVICYISVEEKKLDWMTNAIIIIDIISAVYVMTKGTYYRGYGYVIGADQNPNNLGLAMDLGLFCAALRARKDRKNILGSLAVAILFIYIIIGCGSRKSLFAAIIICALWMIPAVMDHWEKSGVCGKLVLILSILAAIGFVFYYYHHYYINTYSYTRMQTLGDNDEGSSGHRILFYKYALDYFLERPLLGIGLDQFSVWNPFHQYAHSTYAEALADWGIVGCMIYFIPSIWAGFKLISKMFSDKENRYATCIFLAIWSVEIFLGLGQIWFYEIEHLITWTIIFVFLFLYRNVDISKMRAYKYVKG